jgi:hypothetical protein
MLRFSGYYGQFINLQLYKKGFCMKILRFACILFVLNVPVFLFGGEVNFVAQTSKTKVGIGEQFQITFTVNASGSQFKAPSFDDFQFLGGPSQSTSMQIINGNMSQSVSYTYYLAGKKTGTFVISSASISVNGKKYETNSLKIEVTKEQASQNQAQSNNRVPNRTQQNTQQGISEKELADNVFIKASINKSSVYQGEQVYVTYKLYRRIDVLQYQIDNLPKYNGFWKEDLKTDNQTYTESLDGIQYSVTDVKRTLLIPQRSGKLEIDPLDISVLIRLKSRRSNNFFDDVFGFGSYQNYNLPLKCKPIFVTVKSLPGNAPANFSGIVGKLNLEAKLNKDKVDANQSVSLKVNVNGKGNLKILEPFNLELPEEIEVYDPKTTENINISASGISGTKGFEYLLIPRSEGKFNINPLSISYFDIESGTYKTVTTHPFELEVTPGKGGQSIVSGPQMSKKEDLKIKSNDIAFIKTETSFQNTDDFIFGSFLHLLICFLIISGSAGLYFYQKRLAVLKSDLKSYRRSQAHKNAIQNFKMAKEALKEGKSDLFYQNITSTLYNYIGDKLNTGLAQINLDLVKDKFLENKLPDSEYLNFKKIIESCEIARFAPSAVGLSKEEILTTSENIINQIDEKL